MGMFAEGGNRDYLYQEIEPGEFFGVSGMFDARDTMARIVVLSKTARYFAIENAIVRELCDESFDRKRHCPLPRLKGGRLAHIDCRLYRGRFSRVRQAFSSATVNWRPARKDMHPGPLPAAGTRHRPPAFKGECKRTAGWRARCPATQACS